MPTNDDLLAGLTGDGASASEAPAAQPLDIEKFKADMQADFDARISGFQSKVVAPRDEMIAALREELDELKNAGLSEEDRAQLEDQRKDREIEELRAKLELNELGSTYGDLIPVYQQLLGAGSAEEQLKVLQGLRVPPAAATDPDPDPVTEPSDIDPNRPMRSPTGGIARLADGTVMTDELADRILAPATRMR